VSSRSSSARRRLRQVTGAEWPHRSRTRGAWRRSRRSQLQRRSRPAHGHRDGRVQSPGIVGATITMLLDGAAMQYFVQAFSARQPYPEKYGVPRRLAAHEVSPNRPVSDAHCPRSVRQPHCGRLPAGRRHGQDDCCRLRWREDGVNSSDTEREDECPDWSPVPVYDKLSHGLDRMRTCRTCRVSAQYSGQTVEVE
jgi:hypothetical protein